MSNSPLIADIRSWSEQRRLPQSYVVRWTGWPNQDAAALLRIATEFRLRTGQCVSAIDLLEEIGAREGTSVAAILSRSEIARISRQSGSAPDKARAFFEILRVLRFPRLAQTKASINAHIARLRLPPAIHVSYAPDLASDELRVELIAHSAPEIGDLIDALGRARHHLCTLADMIGGANEI
jgi:hypothetical protein